MVLLVSTNSPSAMSLLIIVPSISDFTSYGCKLSLLSITASASPVFTASPNRFVIDLTMPGNRGLTCTMRSSLGPIFPFSFSVFFRTAGPATSIAIPDFLRASSVTSIRFFSGCSAACSSASFFDLEHDTNKSRLTKRAALKTLRRYRLFILKNRSWRRTVEP